MRLHPRWSYGALVIILLLCAALCVSSAREETQNFDEAGHLIAGYLYWKTGDLRWNPEHPPLAKLLNAAPLLAYNPRIPLEHPTFKARDLHELARVFLYHNTVSADTMLFAARCVTIVQFLLLVVVVFWFVRRYVGDRAAAVAAALVAFEPNLIAHGRYVTSDLAIAFYSVAAVAFWFDYLQRGERVSLVLGGLGLGAALASKFSANYLLLVVLILIAFGRVSWKRRAVGFVVLCAAAAVIINLAYFQEAPRLLPGIRWFRPDLPRATAELTGTNIFDQVVRVVSPKLGLAANTYVYGLHQVAEHNKDGHTSYLLGTITQYGSWLYFPVAFLVKSSAALLLGLVAASIALVLARIRQQHWRFLAACIIPAAVLFTLAVTSSINIGVRHILPVYPFAAMVVAAILNHGKWRHVAAAAVALLVVECAFIHPFYLSFFNVISGGPRHGDYYLVDSNLDWGQDVKHLVRYVRNAGVDHICIAYFGMTDLNYYGLQDWPLPWTNETKKRDDLDCLSVVSVTLLHDVYLPAGSYAWMREKQPDAFIGYSMRVYDLRKNKQTAPVR